MSKIVAECISRFGERLLISAIVFISLLARYKTVEANSLQFNVWKENRHGINKPQDPLTLYGRERHCFPPEPVEPTQAHSHFESTWSILFSRYTLDGGDELDAWLKNQETYEETANERHIENPVDKFIPVAFPIVFGIFLCASIFVIPILGGAAFHFLLLLWWHITHPEIKRVGRRFLISKEKMSRKRHRKLKAESMKKPPKSTFRLSKFFRLHSDEDIPKELEESDSDKDWLQNAVPSDEEHDEKFTDEGASLSGLESMELEPQIKDAEIDNDIDNVVVVAAPPPPKPPKTAVVAPAPALPKPVATPAPPKTPIAQPPPKVLPPAPPPRTSLPPPSNKPQAPPPPAATPAPPKQGKKSK